MKRMDTRPIRTLFLLVLLFAGLSACTSRRGSEPHGAGTVSDPQIDSIEKVLLSYSFGGQHDSVIYAGRPALREAIERRDTFSMVYIELNMAQSFLFMGEMDSVRYHLDRLEPLMLSPAVSPSLHAMYFGELGSYSLRWGLDYSKALNYYIEALNWADREHNSDNRILLLANIVNVFYIQNSDKGFEYAREAYELSRTQPDVSLYPKGSASIVMAQMYYVQGEYEEAKRFLTEAEVYVDQGRSLSQKSFIYAMFAWIAQFHGDYRSAVDYYTRAIEFIRFTDPGTASQICLTYGNLLAEMGDKRGAIEMYRRGLSVSDTSGNMEFRKSLLGSIADLSYDLGDYVSAARYSRMYKAYSDTISNRREEEFRELIVQREESELQRMMLAKELEHRKTEQRLLLLLFVVIVVSGFSFLLFLLYYRQRKMYGKLVKKHQEFVSLLELKSNCDTGSHNDTDRALFNRIEQLMRDEKIYRTKNLTLEMLADKTGSNRTYCSRAINTFAGMSFNRYLDAFRIAEATRIIANDNGGILFKQLADNIGYNSVTVFSKAFQRETGCSPSIYRKEVRGYRSDKSSDNL